MSLNSVRLGIRRNKRKVVPAGFVVIFIVMGSIAVLLTRAATPTASLQPEIGSITTATVVDSAAASNGKYVKFGPAVVTPPAGSWLPLGTKTAGWAWQWQLTGTVNETVLDASSNPNKMYDIDMFNATSALISRLKAKGIYVVCYVESGDWGSGRPDAGDFAPAILGRNLDGFPDEKFININALDSPAGPTGKTLRQIMTARLTLAKSKGCDGIEPDLDDLHTYNTGFTITQANQVAHNKFLIDAGHALGMSVGLKNGPDATGAGSFTTQMFNAGADWALSEECNQFNECDGYTTFIQGGRAVFQVEYLDNQGTPYNGANGTCARNIAAGFDGIVKDSSSSLSALPRTPCRAGN
jgi:hypothetical protein